MPTYTGTTGDNSWNLITPGTFTLDGLAGVDTLNLGTSLRSSYNITQASDGAVHIDSISGASAALHATLYNMEVLTFNSGRDVLDLRILFGSKVPPTVTIADNAAGTANGNVTYLLTFSETVTGLATNDFTVSNGSVVSVSGSGSSYSVVAAPAANTEGTMSLTLNAASVTDAYGNPNAATTAAAQPIDTKPPIVNSITPANQSADVAVGSDVVITFSEAIQKGAGSITLGTASGTVVAIYDAATSGNISISGNTLTVNPSADLLPGIGYTVTFPAGSVKDLAGNTYAGSGFSFTTSVPTVTGTAGNDTFAATAGHEIINGLNGTDTVQLPQTRSAYTLLPVSNGFTLATSDGSGTYDLSNIERLVFSDRSIALDTGANQPAGETELLLGAVLGKDLLASKVPLIAAVIDLFDQGYSLQQLSGAVMRLPIWDVLTGKATPTNTDIANYLLFRVNGVPPDGNTLGSAVDALNVQSDINHGQGGFLAQLAESGANQNQVDLIGLVTTGLIFA